MTKILEVDDLRTGFGSTQILHGVTLSVEQGEIAGVFGLNGAGKSVTMKSLAGVLPVWGGSIRFDGDDITKLSAEQRVRRGMGHVPQGRQVFPALSVEENLRLGAYTLRRTAKSRYQAQLDGVLDRFPVLARRRDQLAGSLSGGEQASLAVGRALINDPKLILVDEPSAGLSPVVTLDLLATLRAVAATGVSMVLVEQNITFGFQLADTANLLRTGRVVWSGPVAGLDRDLLARELGIGPMLTAGAAAALGTRAPATKKRAAAERAASVKKTAKKAAPAKEPTPTKKSTPAKKTTAKKTTAKKTTAKKTTAKKTTAKKTTSAKKPIPTKTTRKKAV